MGKSLIIHENRDDFTTQPAGESGRKIACGVISVYVGEIIKKGLLTAMSFS